MLQFENASIISYFFDWSERQCLDVLLFKSSDDFCCVSLQNSISESILLASNLIATSISQSERIYKMWRKHSENNRFYKSNKNNPNVFL